MTPNELTEVFALADEIRGIGLIAGAELIERLAYRLKALEEDDARQVVVDALANLMVKTAHKERNKALAEVERLKAEIQATADAAHKEWIENGQYDPDGVGT